MGSSSTSMKIQPSLCSQLQVKTKLRSLMSNSINQEFSWAMRGTYTCPNAVGQKGLTDWEQGLPAQRKYLPQVCLVPPADTRLGWSGRIALGKSLAPTCLAYEAAQGGVWISQTFVSHCLYTMPQLGTIFPQHRAGEGNSCQSWPSLPTAGLTALPFPPAPENIITKQSYTTSNWNQK